MDETQPPGGLRSKTVLSCSVRRWHKVLKLYLGYYTLLESEGGAAVNRKGFFIRMIVCLLLLLLAAPCALADLSRGSKGEDVRQLQQMLIDVGFLDDVADGIFGKKTQAAVKAIQRYWCVEETGVADEGVLNDLEILWQMVMGIPRENGAPIDDGYLEGLPEYCSWTGDEEGAVEYCWRHYDQVALQNILFAPNAPEKLEKMLTNSVCSLWFRWICIMYEEWEEALGYADNNVAASQYDNFLLTLDDQIAQWSEIYGGHLALGTLQNEMKWLESIGVDLCFDMYGAEPN